MCEIKPTAHINMSKFRPENRELKLFRQTEMSYVPFVRLMDHKTFLKSGIFYIHVSKDKALQRLFELLASKNTIWH